MNPKGDPYATKFHRGIDVMLIVIVVAIFTILFHSSAHGQTLSGLSTPSAQVAPNPSPTPKPSATPNPTPTPASSATPLPSATPFDPIYTRTASNTAGTADQWTTGTNWDVVPPSGSTTQLVFGNGSALAAGATIFTNNNNAGNFQLNILNFTYAGPGSGVAPQVTISGNPLEFVSNGATTPTMTIASTGTVKPLLTISNNIVLTNNLAITGTTNATFTGNISGAGNLTKTGAGTLNLAGANDVLSGNLNINGGGSVNIATGGQLAMTGAGSIALQSSGSAVTVNGTLLYQSSHGWLTSDVPSGTSLTINSGGTYIHNTTAAVDNFLSNLRVVLASGSTFIYRGSNTLTPSVTIANADYSNLSFDSTSGSWTATASGTGTWTVNGDLSIGSGVNFDYGAYASTTAFNGNVTVSGTLGATNGARSFTIANTKALTVNSGGTLNVASGQTITIASGGSASISGTLGGAGSFSDSGTAVVTGSGTYTGTTTIGNTGALTLGNGGATGTLSTSSAITDNGSFVVNRNNAVTQGTDFSGSAISGTGSFTQAGGGATTLNAANTYSGNTVVSGGTLILANSLAIQNSTLNYNNQGGSLSFGTLTSATFGGLSGAQSLALTNTTPAGVALSVGDNNQSTTYSGSLSGGGSLSKVGTGTLTFSGASSYTGATAVQQGTLQLGIANALPTGTTLTIGNTGTSGTLDLNGKNQQLGGLLTAGTAGSQLVENTNNTNATLTLNIASGTNIFGGVLGNSGNENFTLDKEGAGTLQLTNVNNLYNQGTVINGGTLAVDNNAELGTAGVTVTFGGGTLDLTTAGFSSGRTVTLNAGGGTIQVDTGTSTLSGIISGTGALTKTGAGILLLTNANTYSGGTIISAGNIQLSGGSPTGTIGSNTGTLTMTGGIFDPHGVNPTIGNLTGTGGTITNNFNSSTSTVTIGNGNTGGGNFQGVISDHTSGTGVTAITKTGTGVIELSGTNTYTGDTTVTGGMLALGSANSLPGGIGNTGGTSHLALEGGILGASGTFSRSLGTSSATTVDFIQNGGAATPPGGFAGFGAAAGFGGSNNLTVNIGNGTSLIWGGGNDGTATVNWLGGGQTLILGNSAANGTVTFANNLDLQTNSSDSHQRTIQVDRSSLAGAGDVDAIISGVVSSGNSGSNNTFIKTGTGTLVLSAANNNYTGATNINAGTLLVNGSKTGTGAITVNNSGSILGGTGSVAGGVTVGAGAKVQGGDGTTGTTLTLTGALTLQDNSIIQLALGPSQSHSTLARSGINTWTFDGGQIFNFTNLGATTGFYDNIITNVADPGTGISAWTIANAGMTGTFSWDGTNIDLNLTAVPESSTWATGILALLGIVLLQHHRPSKRKHSDSARQ